MRQCNHNTKESRAVKVETGKWPEEFKDPVILNWYCSCSAKVAEVKVFNMEVFQSMLDKIED